MKHILVVAEQKSNVESMLKKANTFSPNKISLVLFTQNTSEETNIEIKEVINKLISNDCETSIVLDSAQSTEQKSEKLIQTISTEEFDTIFLHRPHFKDTQLDFSFIKATLRAPIKSTIFLCGDNKWRPKMEILGTLDILDKSAVQHELNNKVLHAVAELSKSTGAQSNILSVIPISKFKEELDITDQHQVLAKEGAETKLKLESIIKASHQLPTFSAHIKAGSPASNITSVASKLKANIVVMGSVGRTGLKGLLIGNTAEKILNRLTVDTLIISCS